MTLMSGLGLGCLRGVSVPPIPAQRWAVKWRPGRLQGSRLLARVAPKTTQCTRWLRLLAEWIRKPAPAIVGL